jgi:hypothetical protein
MACNGCNKVREAVNTVARAVGIKAQLPMLKNEVKTGVNPLWQKLKGTNDKR